jgi:hypothetical protein
MVLPDFRVGDRVRFRGASMGETGIITERYKVEGGRFHFRVRWDAVNHEAGYTQWDLELAPNGLEVAWEWLDEHGYE